MIKIGDTGLLEGLPPGTTEEAVLAAMLTPDSPGK